MPIERSDMEEMLERVKAREEQAERELADAETKSERDEIKDRLAQLEARNAELEKQLAGAQTEPEPEPEPEPETEEVEEEESRGPKMRRGRKHGQLVQDGPGEMGYIYQGEDEPDLVPVEEAEAS